MFRKISSSDGISVIEKNNQIPFEAYTKDGNTYVCVDNINDETVIRFDGGVTVIDNDYKKIYLIYYSELSMIPIKKKKYIIC